MDIWIRSFTVDGWVGRWMVEWDGYESSNTNRVNERMSEWWWIRNSGLLNCGKERKV